MHITVLEKVPWGFRRVRGYSSSIMACRTFEILGLWRRVIYVVRGSIVSNYSGSRWVTTLESHRIVNGYGERRKFSINAPKSIKRGPSCLIANPLNPTDTRKRPSWSSANRQSRMSVRSHWSWCQRRPSSDPPDEQKTMSIASRLGLDWREVRIGATCGGHLINSVNLNLRVCSRLHGERSMAWRASMGVTGGIPCSR